MKMPKMLSMPKAPVSSVVRRSMAYAPAVQLFAHHAPRESKDGHGTQHMIRPHGGHGPRNEVEK